MSNNFAVIIHGGSGNINAEKLHGQKRYEYLTELKESIDKAYLILENGGSSINAVTEAICHLEDCPLFNAGKGSVFNSLGEIEMDASIMDGCEMQAGAVTNVQLVKNPILLAKEIMNHSKHILLSGEGAAHFALKQKLKIMPKEYFETEMRRKKYLKAKKRDKVELDHDERVHKEKVRDKKARNEKIKESQGEITDGVKDEKMGTVGAVAIDKSGNIAAGTSTGGLNYKKFGRIGDSAIIGSGTFAENASCGISCTGLGEYFMITSAAHEVAALMKYKQLSLKDAIQNVLFEQVEPLGGRGGIIAIDHKGNVEYGFTTTGMFRAYKSSDGSQEAKIFR